ncbi:hypothetical protein LUX57_42505 [Actinomadura madurae]|uniref:hypothetical protein n=1 Tax=Actinomadura madurae TaxID=1993 RepID=UPI0020D1F756|nr:hypothetical protein [Actinomadura madurae]MCP9971010.1 hypothetical protein [Actinomadura madurae]
MREPLQPVLLDEPLPAGPLAGRDDDRHAVPGAAVQLVRQLLGDVLAGRAGGAEHEDGMGRVQAGGSGGEAGQLGGPPAGFRAEPRVVQRPDLGVAGGGGLPLGRQPGAELAEHREEQHDRGDEDQQHGTEEDLHQGVPPSIARPAGGG